MRGTRQKRVASAFVPHLRFLALAALLVLGSGASAAPEKDSPQPADEPLRVSGAVSRPEKISGEPPVYTEMARRARVSGTVILEAILDEEGNVENARILKGLPMGLDQAAMEAVETWKFKPATLEGRPVKVYYVLTVNFKVDDNPPLGPSLQQFLKQVPDFGEHVNAGRFADAAQALDRVAADGSTGPELAIARLYLLLKQSLLDEAWARARSEQGPGSYEMLYLVGVFAREQARQNGVLNAEARADLIDLGLEAETRALEVKSDGLEAMFLKMQLLVDKASLASDPEERLALQREMMELRQRATEVQGKRSGGEPR